MDASTISMLFFIIPLLLKFHVPELGITKSNATCSSASGGGGCVVCGRSSRWRTTITTTTAGDDDETKKGY